MSSPEPEPTPLEAATAATLEVLLYERDEVIVELQKQLVAANEKIEQQKQLLLRFTIPM